MASKNPERKSNISMPLGRNKSAEDALLESFGQLIDEAAERMTHEQFMKVTQ
jgi:hypothetical protein